MNTAARDLLAALETLPERTGSPWERMLADLERYRDTAFGKAHGFGSIRTEADFRERVPARNYEEYRSWITQVTDGEPGSVAVRGNPSF